LGIPKKRLTVRDRILVHLAGFAFNKPDHQVPPQVSQEGIAEAVGIKQRHISQYVQPMITEGLVLERSSYVRGGRQHQKVYFLTDQGRKEADWMQNNPSRNMSDSQPKHTRLRFPTRKEMRSKIMTAR
jgi:predicted transcriptional regulator